MDTNKLLKRIHLQCRRPGLHPWVGKMTKHRKWQPTPVILPGKFHGQRSLAGYSPWNHKALDMTDWAHPYIYWAFVWKAKHFTCISHVIVKQLYVVYTAFCSWVNTICGGLSNFPKVTVFVGGMFKVWIHHYLMKSPNSFFCVWVYGLLCFVLF